VQHTRDQKGWRYRLIAYEDKRVFFPVDFDAMSDLVRTIRRVAPDFSESSLVTRDDANRSYLVFTADWDLDDDQLLLLGFHS
jgi:hypothetical protein